MKKYLILILIVFAISQTQSQTFKIYCNADTATTTWDSIAFGGIKTVSFEVTNDMTSGSDTLFIAIKNDTARANMFPLLKNESRKFFVQTTFIRTKTSANTILRRIIGE